MLSWYCFCIEFLEDCLDFVGILRRELHRERTIMVLSNHLKKRFWNAPRCDILAFFFRIASNILPRNATNTLRALLLDLQLINMMTSTINRAHLLSHECSTLHLFDRLDGSVVNGDGARSIRFEATLLTQIPMVNLLRRWQDARNDADRLPRNQSRGEVALVVPEVAFFHYGLDVPDLVFRGLIAVADGEWDEMANFLRTKLDQLLRLLQEFPDLVEELQHDGERGQCQLLYHVFFANALELFYFLPLFRNMLDHKLNIFHGY